MKLKKNNRDDKVQSIETMICSGEIDKSILHDKAYQLEVADYITLKIFKQKQLTSKRIASFKRSHNMYRMFIDCYERALASLILYLFANNIDTDIGYFYVVQSSSFPGYYKFGQSQDSESRLNQYQVCSPFRDFSVFRYAIINDRKLFEKNALTMYKDFIVNGEWIQSNDIDSCFKSVCGYNSSVSGLHTRFSKINLDHEYWVKIEEVLSPWISDMKVFNSVKNDRSIAHKSGNKEHKKFMDDVVEDVERQFMSGKHITKNLVLDSLKKIKSNMPYMFIRNARFLNKYTMN